MQMLINRVRLRPWTEARDYASTCGRLLRCSIPLSPYQHGEHPTACFSSPLRRLLQAIPILLGVSLVVFGLVHIVPGNPIDMLMPPEASPEVIAQMKAAFGFDKPLYMQYLLWLLRARAAAISACRCSTPPRSGAS